jgi:SAM-dependent methyltransferase
MHKFIYLFLIIYVGVTVSLVDSREIAQPIAVTTDLLGHNETWVNIGQGQSFIVNEGDQISEFEICFHPAMGSHATDILICDLRDSKGTVLDTSIVNGFSTATYRQRRCEVFSFDENKSLTNGTYILTCYMDTSDTRWRHQYYIEKNMNYNSYPYGTQYTSTEGHPENWSTWKPVKGDLKFNITIVEGCLPNKPSQSTTTYLVRSILDLFRLPNKPSQSTTDSNNSLIRESVADKSTPTDIEKPSLKETWVDDAKENIWIITTIGIISSIIFFSIMLIYGPGSKDRADRIFKIYGYFKNKTRKSEDTEENPTPHLTDLEYEILGSEIGDIFKSVYQKERKEEASEVNSKTLEFLKYKLLDLAASGKRIDWLDVGCGDGRSLDVLDAVQNIGNIRYHGTDSSYRYLDDTEKRARKYKLNARLDKIDSAAMKFDSEYDVVSAVLLLHEVDPLCLPYILRNMLRALKGDGTLIIADFEGPYEQEEGVVAWGAEDIRKLLEKIGEAKMSIEFIPSSQYPNELGFYRCYVKKPRLDREKFSDLLQGYDNFLDAKKEESKRKRGELRSQIEERVRKLLNRPDIDLKNISEGEMQRIQTEIGDEYGIKAHKIRLLTSQIEFLDDKIKEFRSGVGCDEADHRSP